MGLVWVGLIGQEGPELQVFYPGCAVTFKRGIRDEDRRLMVFLWASWTFWDGSAAYWACDDQPELPKITLGERKECTEGTCT